MLLQGFVLDALGDAVMVSCLRMVMLVLLMLRTFLNDFVLCGQDKSDRERLLQRVDFLCANSEPERISGAKKMLSI